MTMYYEQRTVEDITLYETLRIDGNVIDIHPRGNM